MLISSDVLCRPIVEFPIRKRTSKLRSRTRSRPIVHLFRSWMGNRDRRFLIPPLIRDELKKAVKSCTNDYSASGFVSNGGQNSNFIEHVVEEPWIFESCIVPSKTEIVSNVISNEGIDVMAKDDSVSTVILINSSLCTLQRVAVLENDELVELLLEPVKTNVQCGSVYLGVVTKLVPYMGGAFVDIDGSRPSLMDICHTKEPFILPFLPQNGTYSNGVEEWEGVEYDISDDEFEGDDESSSNFDFLGVNKGNVNCGDVGRESDVDIPFETKSTDQNANVKVTTGTGKSKWAKVNKGSKIIVQVLKEGLGTKGPTLTAYPKLKSRFWVLVTRSEVVGISAKIPGSEKPRLRVIAKTLQPPGFGLVVRTAASGHSSEELQKDLEGLLSTWKSIVDRAKSAAFAADEGVDGAVPVMLHGAMGQTLSVVQDYFNERVKSLVVDSPQTYQEVTNYLQDIAPNLCDRIELYSKRTPLFDEYNIEEEINNILSKRVPLDNGGYLVIEQTEALVSVDVNGGLCMLGEGNSQEKAVLEVNLAAAKQLARELRLRDIGGIIVVDFIDMWKDAHKRLVYEEVNKAVKRDRSTVEVSELSKNGLMEITRKRVRPSVTFMISEPCTCCHATGRVESLETSFSRIEHEICRLLSTTDEIADPGNLKTWPWFTLRVDQYMCNYLTSGKKSKQAVLSSSLNVWILLKADLGLSRGTFKLKLLSTYENSVLDKNHHLLHQGSSLDLKRL